MMQVVAPCVGRWGPQISQMTQIVNLGRPREQDPQTYQIIGAAMDVHRHLGCGFLEPVYQEALERELFTRLIPCRREVDLPIQYKGTLLRVGYRADFICYDGVLVELKSIARLRERDKSQVINYLSASELGRGLLL